MKKVIVVLLALMPLLASAKGYKSLFNEDHRVVIWDNKKAPHSNGLEGEAAEPKPHRLTNTTVAELLIFEAEESKRTGQAVIICPGGGYGLLSMDMEGADVAKWLAENGITGIVLKYRLPNGNEEVPLEDGIEALRIVRKMSKKLNIDPTKVGVAGFSAGGHLAAYISTFAEVADKPNFSILFYPVITCEKGHGHQGSFNNLLGKSRTEERSAKYSLESKVDANTPPAIMLLSSDDKAVPPINSTRYFNALRANDVRASLHIFPYGGHGWGITDRVAFRPEWQKLVLDWLAFEDKKE